MIRRAFSLMGVVILLSLFTASARAESQPIIYLFGGDGCPHCEVARPILRQIVPYGEGLGDSTRAELQVAIAACLQNGWPDPSLGLLSAAGQPVPAPMDMPEPVVMRDNGFTLAILRPNRMAHSCAHYAGHGPGWKLAPNLQKSAALAF